MSERLSRISWGAHGLLGAALTLAIACSSDGGSGGPSQAGGSGKSGGSTGSPGGRSGSQGGSGGSGGASGAAGSGASAGASGSAGSGSAGSGGQGAPDAGESDAAAPDGGPNAPPVRGDVGAPGFPGWRFTKAIKMDTSAAGADVGGNVDNYPVAVRLNGQNFDFSQAKPQGEDIRFGSADGTPLPYELEHFDAAGKTAAFWILVPQVKGNDAAQSINMYWGNPAAGLADDSKKVFTATNGFVGVWHLDEDGSAEANAYADASEGGNPGTGVNMMPGSRVDGAIGKGSKMLNAMRQWIRVEDADGRFRPAQLTASIWGLADGYPARWGSGGSPGYQCIYSSGEAWTVQRETGGRFESCFNHVCAIGDAMPTKQWFHFVVRRSGGNHQLFMNGEQVAQSGVGTRNDFKPLGIGQMTQYLDPERHVNERRSWEGILDEARVMKTAVDNNWIKLDYESQRPDSKFLVFGETQTRE